MRPATLLGSGQKAADPDEPAMVEPPSEEPIVDLAPDPCPDPLSRWVLAWVGALFLFLSFIQAPGLIEDDTKLPVVMSPWLWIQSVVHLWNQRLYSGASQDVNFGYLFPMAPFFAITHALHIPTWCAERIWLATLLTVGCWGMVRLAESLGIGSRWARVLGGIAYSIAPISVTWTSRSGTLIAVLLMPWLLQPLVAGARTGSPRRAAAKSGVAVAFMGGVNATVIIAMLPVGVLWLLTRERGPRRRALAGWWVLSVVLACFWWAIPALVQGKYGYNYLPYTETSTVTTSTTSVFEALRGASYWLNYFAVRGPLFAGAFTLVTSAAAIMGTAFVTGLGVAGLARRMPERLFLVACLAFGVVVIAIGYSGPLAGPFSHHIQILLQGKLGPLRSVSKFSPDVTLPLILGLMWTVSHASWSGATSRLSRWPLTPRNSRVMIGAVAVVAVLLAAMPFWRQQLYPTGGFSAIPGYWSQTAKWLDAHQGDQTTLLVPGAPTAWYTWGKPADEPLTTLTATSETARSLIPLGSNGNTVMLSAIDTALRTGTSPPGLATYLARSGIDYVVERNDLNLQQTAAPPPALVHQVLNQTPGLTQVASFGAYLPLSQVEFGSLPVYDSISDLHLRAVEIYRVDAGASEVQTFPAKDPLVVSGSTDSLLPLAGSGISAGRATVLAGDPKAAGIASTPGATLAITDGNQREAVTFGSINNDTSYLLGAKQDPSWLTPGIPLNYKVVSGSHTQTVAAPIGASSVSASSYGSTPLFDQPTEGPASAFDGDPTTAWVATGTNDSVGQSLSITLDHAVPVTRIAITPLDDLKERPTISEVTITTDRGSVRRAIPRVSTPVQVSVAPGSTRHLTITIDAVRRPSSVYFLGPLGAGITDVAIPGVTFVPAMQAPTSEVAAFAGASRSPAVVSFSQTVENAAVNIPDTTTSVQPIARKFVLPKAMNALVTGTAVPAPGKPLETLLGFLGEPKGELLSVTSDSQLGDLPNFQPENLVEGNAGPWVAGLGDPDPYLTITWYGARPVGSITVQLAPQASTPKTLTITGHMVGAPGNTGTRTVTVPAKGGTISFKPLHANSLVIHFGGVQRQLTVVPTGVIPVRVPVGLQSIGVPAVTTTTPLATTPSTPVTFKCGDGPTVYIDGVPKQTSVTGTWGDLLTLRPMTYQVCPHSPVPLAAGSHVISFDTPDTSSAPLGSFQVTGLTARDQASVADAKAVAFTPHRTARITSWNPEHRTLAMSAGPATIVQVSQNFSTGWVAKLGGHTLTPVRLDGWQQGWIVPAGAAATVVMNFGPDSGYRLGLGLGAVLLVVLALLAFTGRRRTRLASIGPRAKLPGWALGAVAAIVAVAVGGWLALVLIPLVAVAHRWGGRVVAVVGGMAFVAAGIVVAWDPSIVPALHQGAFSAAAQVFSVIALCAVLSGVVVEERREFVPAAVPVTEEGSSE